MTEETYEINVLIQAELCLKFPSGIYLDLSSILMNVCVRFKAKLKKTFVGQWPVSIAYN